MDSLETPEKIAAINAMEYRTPITVSSFTVLSTAKNDFSQRRKPLMLCSLRVKRDVEMIAVAAVEAILDNSSRHAPVPEDLSRNNHVVSWMGFPLPINYVAVVVRVGRDREWAVPEIPINEVGQLAESGFKRPVVYVGHSESLRVLTLCHIDMEVWAGGLARVPHDPDQGSTVYSVPYPQRAGML